MKLIEENKQTVRRYQEIYNSNDLDAHREVVAEDLFMPKVTELQIYYTRQHPF